MAVTASGSNRSNFADILEPGLREIYFQHLSQIPTMYDKIFRVNSSSKQTETDTSVFGFGKLVKTTEGAPITYEDPLQGYDVTYTHEKRTKGFKVTRELVEDDQYNVINRMPKELATATARTVESDAADIFDNAFTSGTGGDGSYLCADSHAREDGGTAQDNKETHGLDETYLETALLAMRKTLDGKGQRVLIQPDTLLVPSDLEKEAIVLLQSTGRTATNYNEINPYQGRLNLMVWDFLDDTQAWFILDSGVHQLNFFWRVRPEFSQDESFDTDAALYKVRCRYDVGFSDWRGVYGSTGTQ